LYFSSCRSEAEVRISGQSALALVSSRAASPEMLTVATLRSIRFFYFILLSAAQVRISGQPALALVSSRAASPEMLTVAALRSIRF
jgi:hypothetical protein